MLFISLRAEAQSVYVCVYVVYSCCSHYSPAEGILILAGSLQPFVAMQ